MRLSRHAVAAKYGIASPQLVAMLRRESQQRTLRAANATVPQTADSSDDWRRRFWAWVNGGKVGPPPRREIA